MNNSKSKNKILLIGILFSILFVAVPNLASAASIYLSADYPSISVGDTIIVSLVMDPQGKKPNVVDGDVLIKNGVENIKISEFSTAGSVLTHWLQTPSLDEASKISFIGGTPGGFDKTGLLLKIIFLAKSEGQVTFLPDNIKAYNNDEKSTPIEVSVNSLTINISPKKETQPVNQWLEIISKDNQPPKQLSAIVGQDNSLFGGKKFITISAVDDQSGIDYYEVKEGNWPMVRTGQTYVLLDQSESSVIVVAAYDKAGNYSQIILRPVKPKTSYWRLIIIFIVILIIFCGLFIILKKIKKNNLKKKING